MRAAIVIPIYGQAALMGEAVASLLSQHDDRDVRLVLVDDACPDPGTRRKSEMLVAAYPGRVLAWRSPANRGLSAMRNEGVKRALEAWPDIDAIAFVDGDDRVHRSYVARGLDALARHGGSKTADGRRIGWIYEDWHQFGTPQDLMSPAPFQPLFALAACQHTPGCFCLAEMFRDGLRFDEERRGGDAEDWQFWVNAYRNGWRGHHEPSIGFRYRRRIGGLATDGMQIAEKNRAEIQREFPDLYNRDSFLRSEAQSGGRYVFFTGADRVTHGAPRPGGPGEVQTDLRRVSSWVVALNTLSTAEAPAFAAVFSGHAHELLLRAGMLDWALWFLEARRQPGAAAELLIEHAGGAGDSVTVRPVAERGKAAGSVVLVSLLRLSGLVLEGHPVDTMLSSRSCARSALVLSGPELGRTPQTAPAPSFASRVAQIRADLADVDVPAFKWGDAGTWRPYGRDRSELCTVLLGTKALLAAPDAAQRSLVLIDANDLRRPELALDVLGAVVAERDGRAPSLGIIGRGARLPEAIRAQFDGLFLLPRIGEDGKVPAVAEGLMAGFKRVISADCPDIAPLMNGVRRFGTDTALALPLGRVSEARVAETLIHSFKAYHRVLIRAEAQLPTLMAFGVSIEQIDRDLVGADRRVALGKQASA